LKQKLNSLKDKITVLFKQGLTPKELSQSIIVSGLISIIPILGVSTFMITTISLKSKLNLPVMIALSYLMWPVQILLIIPFIRVGEFIFSIPRNHHSVDEIISSFQNSFFQTLSQLSFELFCGFGGWLLTAVPLAVGVYLVSLLFLKDKTIP
jgi:uncharacterized protein (DUF2062 family)